MSEPAPAGAAGYGALLRRPGVATLLGACLGGWTAYAGISLAILLAAEHALGSFGRAGVVLAGFSVTAGVLAPVRGRRIDRGGPRLLLGLAVCHALVLAVLTALTLERVDSVVVLALVAAAAGMFAPPIVATTRGAWSSVVPGHDLRRAYGLHALSGDVATVSGPPIVSGIATGSAALGPALCGAAVLASAALVARLVPRTPGPKQRGQLAIRRPGVRALAIVGLGFGLMLGAIELGVPAAAKVDGKTGLAGVALGALAVGSAVGSLLAGRSSRVAVPVRLTAGLVALGALLVPAWAFPHVGVLIAVIALCGLPFGVVNVAVFELIDTVAPPGERIEALAWLTTAEALGAAAGSAFGGLAVTPGSAAPAFALAALAAAAAALLAAAARRALA